MVNIGDTYNSHSTGKGNVGGIEGKRKNKKDNKANTNKKFNIIPDKCLTMIPFRFAIEMVNRGWILRNTIIWHKRNCMPSSVKDRFTVDFEYLFFFSKKKKYYFETQYEPMITDEKRPNGVVRDREYNYNSKGNNNPKAYLKQDNVPSKNSNLYEGFNKRYIPPEKGRNKRTVWTINPKPFKEAHFAVYPEELCETPIKAGCPEFVCIKCGNPKVLDIEIKSGEGEGKPYNANRPDKLVFEGRNRKSEKTIKGYKPTCKCNAGFTSGIVLDPFFGSGTTGLVALKQNKQFIGIELNEDYIKIANKRLKPFLEQTKL